MCLEPIDFGDIYKSDDDQKDSEIVSIEMLNDDTTPMEFVVNVLTGYFQFSEKDATKLMMTIHRKGSGAVHDIKNHAAKAILNQIKSESDKRGLAFKCRVTGV